MLRSLSNRISLTTKLLALASAAVVMLVLIDYVALLELPRRISRDAVELTLRESTHEISAALRDERLLLREELGRLGSGPNAAEFNHAIVSRDRPAIDHILLESGFSSLRFGFVDDARRATADLGLVQTVVTANEGQRSQSIIFYRDADAAALDRAAEATNREVNFAIEHRGEFIVTSDEFPANARVEDMNARAFSDGRFEFEQVELGGDTLHAYSQALAQSPEYEIHALSTMSLESAAVAAPRRDLLTAVLVMTIATLSASLMIGVVINRTMRRFANRVRQLADGDYGSRLPVHGGDAFADLSDSVNLLSIELERRVGQLENTNAAFRSTLESIEEGICTWDASGQVRYWNRGAEQLTGVVRDRANDDAAVVEFLKRERTPGTRRLSIPVHRSGGSLVVDLVVTPMPGGGVLQTFRDTTLADMLQQMQRNFMATAAHELRTPITTILGFADTLVNPDLELSEPQRVEFLAIVNEQAHRLQEIADAFFTSHQLASERVEVSITSVSVEDVVTESVDRAAEHVGANRQELVRSARIDITPGLAVRADRRALVGVIAVLLENAGKYGAAPLEVVAQQQGGKVVVRVADGGPGIDPHHHARIFDPFYRVDVDMRTGVGGAGLGLFTARKLVEAMRGVIRIERSGLRRGAAFVVELPTAPASAGAPDVAGPEDGTSISLVG